MQCRFRSKKVKIDHLGFLLVFPLPWVFFSRSLLSSEPELIVCTSSLSERVITSCKRGKNERIYKRNGQRTEEWVRRTGKHRSGWYSLTFFSVFIAPSILTLDAPVEEDWLVSQEATLLFPHSSGTGGCFLSSVPTPADMLSPSLLSWLSGAQRRQINK